MEPDPTRLSRCKQKQEHKQEQGASLTKARYLFLSALETASREVKGKGNRNRNEMKGNELCNERKCWKAGRLT